MINKKMTITDALRENPKAEKVFVKHGMHCIGCMAAFFENIEQGAAAHGISIEALMNDLNKTEPSK